MTDDPTQLSLFSGDTAAGVRPAAVDPEVRALAERLPATIHLGTSSWSFPGWAGLVWQRRYSEARLARDGLTAYAAHPLLTAVGVDRTYYGPMTAAELARYRDAVPPAFRFVVKAHEALTLAHHRSPTRDGTRSRNPAFLDADYARREVVTPFVDGLGDRGGILVFQVPPQASADLGGADRFAARLEEFLGALPTGPRYAVELRNTALLTPAYAAALRRTGASHCLNGHPRMPPIDEQIRRLGGDTGPVLAIRWMLNRSQRYDGALERYQPFDRLQDPDGATRGKIAEACAAATAAAKPVYVTVNNKAEGSAPLSVTHLARAIADVLG